MSKLTPTSRNLDCAVCGDESGNCRQSDLGGFLCMTESSAKLFDIINGYKCLKPAGSGLWATFGIATDEPQKTAEERKQIRLSRNAKEKALYQSGLNADDRHIANTALLAQLPLNDADIEDLLRRGLSVGPLLETFRSIEPGQTLDLPINSKTPGVGFGGRKLLTRTAGYLVPAHDLEGRITAFQIRNRHYDGNGAKYPWLSASTQPANLQNGEMPLTFAGCIGDGDAAYLGEGLLKPIVAAERLGISVIGASGGMFASSPQQFKQWIERLNPSKLILCPDGGDLINYQVMARLKRQFEFFTELGLEIKILWWGQSTKANGDIDEISREQFEQADLISWEEFAAKVEKPLEPQRISVLFSKPVLRLNPEPSNVLSIVEKLDEKAQKRENWLKAMAEVAGLPAGVKPTREAINKAFMAKQLLLANHTEGTYQALALAPANERRLYLLDGQKGTRKTSVASKSLMDAAKLMGLTCLVIVPSRLLSRDASRVLEALCHLDSGAESARYLVTCPESLYKFARQQWDVVIVDECNEDVLRTFDGSLGVNPDLCQRVLEEILKTASTIAIANDQMYRPSVQAVQRLSGILPQEIITVQRKRPPSEMVIKLYLDCVGGEESETATDDDMPAPNDAFYGWLARLIEAIESGGKVAIPCGSQSRARTIDRVLRAHFKGQGIRGQVLDGVATPTKVKSEFASDPDQWLARVQPSWVIWTPCFNSGVSIESDYFTHQFEAISVFEGANAASQRGERVRAVLGGGRITERHIFLSNRGLSAYPDPAIFTAGYWRNLADNIANAKAEPSDMALAKSIGAEKFLSHHKDELIEKLDKKPELFEYWAIQAREIFFKLETLKAEWLGNGWEIEAGDFTKADAEKWKGAVDVAKQSIVESKSRALAKARAVAAEGQDLSPYAAVRAKKHHLGEQLDHSFARLKDSSWLEAWEVAPDDSGGIKAQRINALIRMSVEAPELWATVLRLDTLRTIAAGTEIESLPALPIPAKEIAAAKLLTACPGISDTALGMLESWDKTQQIVKDAATYLRANASRLATLSKHSQRVLGLQFTEVTPIIKCFHKALQMAGLTAHAAGRTNKLWRYRLQAADDCQGKIEAKQSKGAEATYKDLRNLFRSESLTELQQQITTRLDTVIGIAADAWQSIADTLAVMGGGVSPQLVAPDFDKLLAESIEESYELPSISNLMLQAQYCLDVADYERIRRNFNAHGVDFDSQCWPFISPEQKQKIISFYEAA